MDTAIISTTHVCSIFTKGPLVLLAPQSQTTEGVHLCCSKFVSLSEMPHGPAVSSDPAASVTCIGIPLKQLDTLTNEPMNW